MITTSRRSRHQHLWCFSSPAIPIITIEPLSCCSSDVVVAVVGSDVVSSVGSNVVISVVGTVLIGTVVEIHAILTIVDGLDVDGFAVGFV